MSGRANGDADAHEVAARRALELLRAGAIEPRDERALYVALVKRDEAE